MLIKKYLSQIIFLVVVCLACASCTVTKNISKAPSAKQAKKAVKCLWNESAKSAAKTIKRVKTKDAADWIEKKTAPVFEAIKGKEAKEKLEQLRASINLVTKVVTKESKAIVHDVIKELDVDDAVAIISGGEETATKILKEVAYHIIRTRYQEKFEAELEKYPKMEKYWPYLISAYNLFVHRKVDDNLSSFLAELATNKMFEEMAKEEEKIREKPERVNDKNLKRVLEYYGQ